jgi:hypothetical protein
MTAKNWQRQRQRQRQRKRQRQEQRQIPKVSGKFLDRVSDGVVGFDEGAEAVEGGVPLAGERVEVVLEGLDGEGVDLVEALAAGVGAADEAGSLEDAEVLGDGLAGDGRAFCKLGYRALLAGAELGQQRETCFIAEGGE